jgi:hypothetical protein
MTILRQNASKNVSKGYTRGVTYVPFTSAPSSPAKADDPATAGNPVGIRHPRLLDAPLPAYAGTSFAGHDE